MSQIKLFTIGFTKKSAEEFFSKIRNAGVKRLIDIRLNNVSQLAGFAKRDDLAFFLKELCRCEYLHKPQLAPTKEILDNYKNKKNDWPEYVRQFSRLIESRSIENEVSLELLDGACFLCSEPTPDKCHRGLVVEYLKDKIKDIKIKHLQKENNNSYTEIIMWVDIVVFANSIKHQIGRSIAGRIIGDENDGPGYGPWIRPVSRIGKGELYPQHFTLEDGEIPSVFDTIRIFVDVPANDITQPENWFVSDNRTWKRHDWDMGWMLKDFIENPQNLWLVPEEKSDRVRREYLDDNPLEQTLYLLKLQDAVISEIDNKYRLRFLVNCIEYDLAITDPQVKNIIGNEPYFILHHALVCVSITPTFSGRYAENEFYQKQVEMVALLDENIL